MKSCVPKMVIRGTYFHIAQCTECGRIGFCYRNLLLGFEKKVFIDWGKELMKKEFREHACLFPDGNPHIIIDSCHFDIQFTFTEWEFEELCKVLFHGIMLIETQDSVYRSMN
ncbi:hypothetical protein [Membranihabitans maritimus]|uniref:hypothetical protein n=1 Tax=Membranihabitans maritimus TaxID=2904244 RepID=UPI001F34D796|nr:hypothetical protein [Membranihabitans maritimus]